MLRNFIFVVLVSLLTFSLGFAQLNNDPDRIETEQGDLVIHPVLHGTVIFEWNGQTVYMDPWGSANLYDEKPAPDVILITHPHGDHLSPEALASLNTTNTSFYVPQAVADEMPEEYLAQTTVISNGESMEYEGITINAVPMYNLPEEGARHAKGWGNGYVLSMGGKDVYVSGDTEGIPEMRNLEGIDVAFVCMNLPYTMDINQASDAVLDFEPTIVYPYHHRGQDIEEFKKLVDAGNKDIEVRLKNWYPR
ncbi:MAG: MBL fold metallo-hydrolase [Balneola sp.]|jgi:L-ascorbate metabolism protein UlaG (beta-lactamase superfamily)|nr:MBL fold metallo-hydrolase [Balneola sp.]MBE80473.1 MBL fold metallo-hydrolase [Balneola sp.]|tara:strand:- start:1143 stop:1892 length:750 start_codon:yes stop_codon:yes gene_type:complete